MLLHNRNNATFGGNFGDSAVTPQQRFVFGLLCIQQAQEQLRLQYQDYKYNCNYTIENNADMVLNSVMPSLDLIKEQNRKNQRKLNSEHIEHGDEDYNYKYQLSHSEIQNKINELQMWMKNNEKMKSYTFGNGKDSTTLSREFEESFELVCDQKEKLLNLCGKHKQVLQEYTQASQEISTLTTELQAQAKENRKKQQLLNEIAELMSDLRMKVKDCVRQYNKQYKKYQQEYYQHAITTNSTQKMQNNLTNQKELASKCKSLLTQYNQFSQETIKYTREMQIVREQQFEQFESKWLEWDYNDIIFWFKVKLNYFDWMYNGDYNNFNNNGKNTNNHCDDSKQNESESDIGSIDFSKVHTELEEQRIRGKFLSLINRSDLRNLGFTLFEHQCILEKEIATLVGKYPIPKPQVGDIRDIADNSQVDTAITPNGDTIKDDKYRCPITKQIMKEPVIACDNKTYEKDAIIDYLRKHGKTPSMNKLFFDVNYAIDTLLPDYELKTQIEKVSQH